MRFLPILLFFIAFPVLAQSDPTVYLYINPKNPGPNTAVSATLQSYSIDLETSSIRWLINGIEVESGTGDVAFDFETGASGSSTLISAVITTQKGDRVEKNRTIRPASVDILWYATDSTTPFFYKGKPLRTNQTETVFVAMPNISGENAANPDRFIYDWYYNNSRASLSSGRGKNTFSISPISTSGEPVIKVIASSLDGRYSAESSIQLDSFNPEVILYERDPLLGVLYNNALIDQINLEKEEITVSATPFFFRSNNVEYDWSISDTSLSDELSDSEVVFRKESASNAYSDISIMVSSLETILQKATELIRINY